MTVIYADYIMNVPEQVRALLPEIIDKSINVNNRTAKKIKLGFNTSEDALTWTVFRHLQISNGISALIESITSNKSTGQCVVYYWGTPVTDEDMIITSKRKLLESVLLEIGENDQKMSEPDIIIEDDETLIFLEIKFGSLNDSQDTSEKWKKYDNRRYFKENIMNVPNLREYQLVRNWCIGNMLAEKTGKKFKLINLVFSDKDTNDLAEFKDNLNQTEKSAFKRMNWRILLQDIAQTEESQWLVSWLSTRKPKLIMSDLLTGKIHIKYNENEKVEAR
ncbi:MAG TPA: hypothetical protein VJ861_05495 [Treponemataceae bacterium]|nr:hypothetical protein [Treponemataceae bacterium]